MDRLDETALARIEAELGRRIDTEFGLDLSGLVLDMVVLDTPTLPSVQMCCYLRECRFGQVGDFPGAGEDR